MQDGLLFEYAVIRVVPRVEREEFINVGVILYCAKLKFLRAVYVVDVKRLECFSGLLDVEEVEGYLGALVKICNGGKGSGPIGEFDLPSRFRWLTAVRSTVLQTSRVHPGFCDDPAVRLEQLFQEQVL